MRVTFSRSAGIEMTADAAFAGRVRRLAAVSVVALGLVWLLAVTRTAAGGVIDLALLLGWLAMPGVLGASLVRPVWRRLVVVPAVLTTAGLLGVCITTSHTGSAAHLGWLLITVGVLLGGVMGAWFWYRWLPVPAALAMPFSPARWTLIVLHVAPIVAGLLLVLLG